MSISRDGGAIFYNIKEILWFEIVVHNWFLEN